MWLCLLLVVPLVRASIDCALHPILKGVSTKQNLGQGQKKMYPLEPDCKQRCISETSFECTAMLWGGDATSDCFLYDKVDLSQEIFVDQRVYMLYVSVCDGEPIPSVGYCQFLLNQSSITAPSDPTSVSPGQTTESSCREFCIANYWGRSCSSFVVSTDRASLCTLYSTAPTGTLASGPQNLWTKNCFPPPKNCEYTQWSEWAACTVSCGTGVRTRSRSVLSQASGNGIPCMESEESQTGSCGTQACDSGCIYSEWTAFSECNATCTTTGYRSRTRSIIQQSGSCTEPDTDYKECASTIECDRSCIYSAWSDWETCNQLCTSTRSRSLVMGDASACEIEYGPLTNEMVCEGGLCTTSGTATTPASDTGDNGNSGGATTQTSGGNGGDGGTGNNGGNGGVTPGGNNGGGNIQEPGCKIPSIDPSSRVSSKGYKAVGARQDCAAMCLQETSFTCEAYITTGPGGPCVLQSTIDQSPIVLSNSRYYLQDVNCKANSSSGTGVCTWQMTGSASDPTFSAPGGFVSIGLTIDAPHCSTLCSMNFPIYRPHPCVAYAWNPFIPFESGHDNCFMYDVNAVANISAGQYDLYRLQCPQ